LGRLNTLQASSEASIGGPFFRVGADVADIGKLRHVARLGLLCVPVSAMNLGLAVGAEAFERRLRGTTSLLASLRSQ
jgi:hypothetical protein